MGSRTPSYLIKNRYGIYYFQYRIPLRLVHNNKQFFRKSLRTKNKNEALKQTRMWMVIMDKIASYIFDEKEKFEEAMSLLMRYKSIGQSSWMEINDFLSELDGYDEMLLDKAQIYDSTMKYENVVNENKQLKQTLDSFNLKTGKDKKKAELIKNKKNIALDELIANWLLSKTSNGISLVAEQSNAAKLLSRILTEANENINPRINDISEDMISDFILKISYLPPSINKSPKLKNKSIEEILKLKLNSKSRTTIYNQVQYIINLFKWADAMSYPINKDFITMLRTVKKPKKKEKKRRVPFDKHDLKNIFLSTNYTKGSFKNASDYWVPLISLFTGARMSEIIQLYVSDIILKDGIWLFDINENGKYKKLKSDESPRLIPIHKQLINLGFVKFMEHQKKNKKTRLFPDEHRNNAHKFGAFSNRFSRYRKVNNILPHHDKELRDFHSFRHNVRTALEENEIRNSLIDDIIGHSSKDRSIGKAVYSHSDLIKGKTKAIQTLKYIVDFSKIMKWDKCDFTRKPFREK